MGYGRYCTFKNSHKQKTKLNRVCYTHTHTHTHTRTRTHTHTYIYIYFFQFNRRKNKCISYRLIFFFLMWSLLPKDLTNQNLFTDKLSLKFTSVHTNASLKFSLRFSSVPQHCITYRFCKFLKHWITNLHNKISQKFS